MLLSHDWNTVVHMFWSKLRGVCCSIQLLNFEQEEGEQGRGGSVSMLDLQDSMGSQDRIYPYSKLWLSMRVGESVFIVFICSPRLKRPEWRLLKFLVKRLTTDAVLRFCVRKNRWLPKRTKRSRKWSWRGGRWVFRFYIQRRRSTTRISLLHSLL